MNISKKNDGYTLIEVLIAIAIFSIGILAVASMQTDAIMKTVSSRNTTEALQLASANVEFLHGIPLYNDSLDLDGDGNVEQFDIHPWLIEGTHWLENGKYGKENIALKDWVTVDRYRIEWTVTDDEPLPPIPAEVYSTDEDLTISKTIVATVFETQRPNQPLATLEMIKVWDRDG